MRVDLCSTRRGQLDNVVGELPVFIGSRAERGVYLVGRVVQQLADLELT
jgi:hypothetical protein